MQAIQNYLKKTIPKMMIRGRLKYSAKVLNTKFIFAVGNFENGLKFSYNNF